MKNKFRNLVLALLCLVIFTGGGFIFYRTWVVQKPFAIILFLVPNLDVSTFTAARIYSGGANARLELENFPHIALLRNTAADSVVGDAAAVASAIATGERGNNGQFATGTTGGVLPTLFDIARQQGRSLGVVTNGKLTSPSIAPFFAPGCALGNFEQISLALLEKSRPEVIFGGGGNELLPEVKGGIRKDGRDLMLQARQSGYDIVRMRAELSNTPRWRSPQILGVFAPDVMSFASKFEGKSSEPDFTSMVRSAIELLQIQRKGYLLVVDCSLIATAEAQNSGEHLLQELVQVDHAVSAAVASAGENSLIIVAGTLSSGGFQLNGTGLKNDSGIAILGQSPQGVPAVTWATGPGASPRTDSPPEPVAFSTAAPLPVATDVLGFFRGSTGEMPDGFLENTAVFTLIQKNL